MWDFTVSYVWHYTANSCVLYCVYISYSQCEKLLKLF